MVGALSRVHEAIAGAGDPRHWIATDRAGRFYGGCHRAVQIDQDAALISFLGQSACTVIGVLTLSVRARIGCHHLGLSGEDEPGRDSRQMRTIC